MKKRLSALTRRNYVVRLAATGCIVLIFITTALIARIAITSGNDKIPSVTAVPPTQPRPYSTPITKMGAPTPIPTSPTRVSIVVGNTHDLQIATGVDSFVIVSPEIALAVQKNRFTLSITATKIGETMLIGTYGTRRQTYIIDVVGKPRSQARIAASAPTDNVSQNSNQSSGSFTTTFAGGSDTSTSLVRQNVDYRRKLSKGRTLRVSGEMFKLFGGANSEEAIARVQNYSLNRLSVGIDAPNRTIDLLDSNLNISPMSFNGYTMRGFHLVNTPRQDANAKFEKKGAEVYAGLARPSLAFFGAQGGMVAGAMVPVITSDDLQLRAGFTAVAADEYRRNARGGVVAHATAIYAPTKESTLEGETSFAHGDLSWRARVDVNKAVYGGSAEVTRLARSSPFSSIGAQPGGRESEQFSFYWRPVNRISTSFGYNHTLVSRQTNSQSANYDRSLLFANVGLKVDQRSSLNFRYSDQKIETAFRGGTTTFQMMTRAFSARHSFRFNRHLSNTFEARINFNKEGKSNESLETGFQLREQLRVNWNETSITGFVNYTNKTPSLTSLIVRNPQLLPPLLQNAFELDPIAFLGTYRDRLAFLLGGVELPLTRSFDAGARFQRTFSRFTVSAETRYTAGEVYAVNQKSVSTWAGVAVKLDRSNSIRVNGWRSFGANPRSGVTVSYTHQFGGAEKGFQFTKLLGMGRGKVRGRVFHDLNGNGIADGGEPGIAGMKIQIDGKRHVTTGNDGRYEFTADHGRHQVALISPELGVRLLASTPTERSVDIDGRQRLDLNFGVRDHGSLRGRVLNDGVASNGDQNLIGLGIGGVKVTLRYADAVAGEFVLTQVTRTDGSYDFQNLRPGQYVVELDSATIPANHRMPDTMRATSTIFALRPSEHDFFATAQRAVTGTVYVDLDRDGIYKAGIDRPIANAQIIAGDRVTTSGADGSYIHRNLPSGQTTLTVRTASGHTSLPLVLQFSSAPETKRKVDLRVEN